jgi:dihydropteroate synthase type 2
MKALTAQIVGIVNITEDSFSDGGLFLDPDQAIARARELFDDGADVVELGPASSHPEARAVDASEQIRRIAPVLDALSGEIDRVCVDTCEPETQRYCLARKVGLLNDIGGFADASFHDALGRADCTLIVMHSLAPPPRAPRAEADAAEVFAHILQFFEHRIAELERAGIARRRLVLDPGMGLFLGANPEPSLRVLACIETLKARFGLPVMISVSRKSFLREITGRALAERGAATLAAEIWSVQHGAGYIRTHDARALRDALNVLKAIEEERATP